MTSCKQCGKRFGSAADNSTITGLAKEDNKLPGVIVKSRSGQEVFMGMLPSMLPATGINQLRQGHILSSLTGQESNRWRSNP
jgi:hypothetical protein